jgi:heme exporter protein A
MLCANQIAFRRGDEWLFKNLTFQIEAGQMVWLRGQNGRGKTSLLRLVVNLAQPDAGTLTWNAEALDQSEAFRHDLVYLGHANGLKDDLTAAESLEFLARLHQRDAQKTGIDAALKRLCIDHRRNRPIRTLSQGQRKRVALARLALEKTAGLWVLDEPFDALDANGIEIVYELLQEHLARQGSVLLTSHLPIQIRDVRFDEIDLDAAHLPLPG